MSIIRTIEGEGTDYAPGVSADSRGGGRLATDPSGNLKTRGPILTDEGGYRCNFSGTSLYLPLGNCTFINGSTLVTGSNFNSESVHVGEYIKLDADGESALTHILTIVDDNNIILAEPYPGSSATGASSISIVNVNVGTGMSYSVTNGNFIITTGTTSGSIFELSRHVDYNPMVKQTGLSISQRSNSQTVYVGLYDQASVMFPNFWAWFKFSGTDNSVVLCESAFSKFGVPTSYETESYLIKLPKNAKTENSNRYRIECLTDRVRFLINGEVVCENYKSIPNPYALLSSAVRVSNDTSLSTSTTISVDYDCVQNFNKVITAPINDNDPSPASTNDLETLVDLITLLIGRTGLPDSLGRIRGSIDAFNGTLLSTGTGTGGAGIPRVTVSTDSTTNVTFSNGVAVLTGSGYSGTGSLRVSVPTEAQTQLGMTLPIIYNNILVS